MSVENNVFMVRENMPSPQQWLEAIKSQGFEMDMDTDFDVVEHEGFLPCKYKGQDAGFEYYAEDVDIKELLEDGLLSDDEARQLGTRVFLVSLITHSDFREYMTSMIASGVLCSISDGMFAEGGEPPFITAAESIKWVKDCVPEIEKEF